MTHQILTYACPRLNSSNNMLTKHVLIKFYHDETEKIIFKDIICDLHYYLKPSLEKTSEEVESYCSFSPSDNGKRCILSNNPWKELK